MITAVATASTTVLELLQGQIKAEASANNKTHPFAWRLWVGLNPSVKE